MISHEVRKDDGIVLVKVVGRNTTDEYHEFATDYFSDISSHKIRSMLLDWREFQGWEGFEVPDVNFFAWIESRPLIDRMALVFHDGVAKEASQIEEFFSYTDYNQIRKFSPEQYEEALEWLKAQSQTGSA